MLLLISYVSNMLSKSFSTFSTFVPVKRANSYGGHALFQDIEHQL